MKIKIVEDQLHDDHYQVRCDDHVLPLLTITLEEMAVLEKAFGEYREFGRVLEEEP